MSTKNTKTTKINAEVAPISATAVPSATDPYVSADKKLSPDERVDHVSSDHEVSDVVTYKTESASKLSLRSTGLLTYQLGYVASTDQLFVRLKANATGGYFSQEWVPVEAIYHCLLPFATANSSFTAVALKSSFLSKSQNNAGFLAAVLKSEGLIHCQSGKSNLLLFDDARYQLWLKQQFVLAKQGNGESSTTATLTRVTEPDKDLKLDTSVEKKAQAKADNKSPGSASKSSALNMNDLTPEEIATLDAVSVG